MTEETPEPSESINQALKIIKILLEFSRPECPSEVPSWLNQVESLKLYLSNLWKCDTTGKVMIKCLNVLYNDIASSSTSISPAVWCISDLVSEEKITEFVEGILSDTMANDDFKVQTVLTAIIEGLCQSGPYAQRLQDWIPAIVKGLEARNNYSVLSDVCERVIIRLLKSLCMPYFRSYTYPIFRQFLYSNIKPYVFFKIIDFVPHVIHALQKDLGTEEVQEIYLDFIGLLRILLVRFSCKGAAVDNLKMFLTKLPEGSFDPDSMTLWTDTEFQANWPFKTSSSEYNNVKSETPYKGLLNQGNTCFMNSVLQVLYMTTIFRKELFNKEIDASEIAANDLQQLFAFMQESSRRILEPNRVMNSTLPPTFRRGYQQDSSEYLIYLLDILHENENKIIKRNRQENSVNKNSQKKKEDLSEVENTVIERLFGGVSMSTTVCSSCKRSFPKKDNFRSLHLSVSDNSKLCDLQELINISLQPEELCCENMYDCTSCGMKSNATRRHIIVKAPQHLVLILKLFRFDPVRKQRLKLHTKLTNVKSIELPVHNSSLLQTHSVMYDLRGVVLHSGSSLDGGHYFSSAVDQFGTWYIFNDSVVSLAKYEWNSSGGTPYILILRQSNVSDPPASPLPSFLQLLVNSDNQKFLAEKRYEQGSYYRKKDYDDDWDDSPPPDGSLGGPGPPLVF